MNLCLGSFTLAIPTTPPLRIKPAIGFSTVFIPEAMLAFEF